MRHKDKKSFKKEIKLHFSAKKTGKTVIRGFSLHLNKIFKLYRRISKPLVSKGKYA